MNTIEKQRFLDLNREVRNRWNVYFEENQEVLTAIHLPTQFNELTSSWDAYRYSSANLDSFLAHIND
jgi:hypothetical protein